MTRHFAIVVAAGSATRMGGDLPKQFLMLDHRPLVVATVDALAQTGAIHHLVVVVPEADVATCRTMMGARDVQAPPVTVVAGGQRRQDSVRCGLAALDTPAPTDLVAVHDGARPFVASEAVLACLEAAARNSAAILAIPAQDTLKSIDEHNRVVETIPRDAIVQVQTPQIFEYALLCRAHDAALTDPRPATDDAELVQRIGGRVVVVPGSPANIKITTPGDLAMARAMKAASKPSGQYS